MVRSMMTQTNFPFFFWEDALLTATYILNCVPSKSVTLDLMSYYQEEGLN